MPLARPVPEEFPRLWEPPPREMEWPGSPRPDVLRNPADYYHGIEGWRAWNEQRKREQMRFFEELGVQRERDAAAARAAGRGAAAIPAAHWV